MGILVRRPSQNEDGRQTVKRGSIQRLSKATWANITASRCRLPPSPSGSLERFQYRPTGKNTRFLPGPPSFLFWSFEGRRATQHPAGTRYNTLP